MSDSSFIDPILEIHFPYRKLWYMPRLYMCPSCTCIYAFSITHHMQTKFLR